MVLNDALSTAAGCLTACLSCIVQNAPDAEAAAVRLTTEAFQRGSNDNISCIVVVFNFDDAPAAAAAAVAGEPAEGQAVDGAASSTAA